MDKKYRFISMICAICGIMGGILMIVAAFMEDAFPRPLWFVAAICMFLNVIGIIMNYHYVRRQENVDEHKESK